MKKIFSVGKRPALALFLMIALGGFALLITGCAKERTWQIGSPAPEISCLDFNDRTVKLAAFRGKVVVLRFWATGCNGCIAGMPALDEYGKKYQQKDLAVLAINMGNPKQQVAAFVRDLHLSYPLLLDPALIATRKYGVLLSPTIFFIDRQGMARKIVAGEITQDLFEKTVDELL